ncbi:transcription factor TFIIIB component B'' homolog isoform X2 [Python bivittatus]|uniref:Transcription factor TFIIIB component B'' homolog isoform X2 n=1 Tax=Python bivittatus TaxID=176946 RepID=A0A9F5IXQ9_PYTBI|nr:transcription factor TFIIIB component B'' homolog isoform X2 [Python bivittatus]
MFRRARFSVKPNVRPNAAGRGSNSGAGTGSVVPAVAAAADAGDQHGSAPTTWSSTAEDSSMLHPGDAAASGDLHLSGDSSRRNEKTSDISGDGDCRKHAEVLPQRRKRISTMPNLIKPRIIPPSTHHTVDLTSKCSQKQGPHSPAFDNPLFQKEASSPEKTDVESSPKSPILPEKKTPVPQVPQFSPFKKPANKEPSACVPAQRSDEALPKNTSSPLKERPTQETLLEDETTQSKSASANKKRNCSDREKIIKTQKLRKMLKEELKKEKKQRKFKYPVIEKNMPEDRSKMIMRDFIYYLPENNPMKSSLAEEKKTEKTSTVAQAKESEERIVAEHDDENEEEEDDEEQGGGGGEDDGSLLVPRVKVAEDGSIILDEESLTVEVLRTKGQCVVEENDPIFERGSTTTYSSFRKSYYTRPWSEKETDMFFLAISMVGTDFSMISQLFPHRGRIEIKNKFKREEKVNGWRIDKAFKEKRPFDFSLFTKLLEKVLENERRKKDKDAGCQHQKDRNSNKRNTSRSQKKRKDKVVNGQSNHGHDEHQDGRTSDMEIEVDAETAEKENEESPSILEQAEEQTVIESTVTKKKRKRRKKDSEQETENLLEERTIPAEMVEEERTRKKRKNIPANDEMNGTGKVGGELEVPNRTIPDETLIMDKEESSCCITLNEEAEKDHSVQKSKSREEDISSANSEYCIEQDSVSQMPPNKNIEGFEKANEAKSEVAVRGKLDENQNMSSQNHGEEIMETDRAISEKHTQEEQLKNLESDLTGASEKMEPLANNPLIVKVSSESLVESKAAYVSGFATEETCKASSDFIRVTEESQKAFVEKTEVRGRRQRPKPNIIKASGRKEASAPGEVNKPRSDGAVEKENEQNDAPIILTAEIPEAHCQGLDTESATSKQSTSQESSKQTVLKPAPLARGRFQRPKPNLGRVARRQELSGRRTGAEEKTSEEAITEKTVMQTECNDSQLLNKDIAEATAYEADMMHCEALEKGMVVGSEKVDAAHPNQSPVKNPVECERDKLRNASLSLDIAKDVVNPASRDSSLQEEKKDNSVEIEHPLESSPSRCKENLENASDREELLHTVKHKLETAEKSSVNITSDCNETSNLNEAAKSETFPFSEECPTNAQEEIATNEIHLSLQNLPELKNDASNEISLASDTQKKELVSKRSSQGESKQSDTQSTPLLRGRFQRPKPNIGKVIGRKEKKSLEGNELTTSGNLGLQKSEPTKTTSMTQIKCVDKILSDEALESRLEDSEKVIQKNSLAPSTFQNSSDLHLREKSIFQEDKSRTIKPAQLVRGRFQRPKLNVGRISCNKEVPVSENTSAPIVGEVKEMEVIKKDDLYPTLEDEVSAQASPDNLDRKEGSESIETSSERFIDQKKHPSSEKSLPCGLLKNQDEIERKNLDTLESDTFDPQEINQSESIKPAHLMIGHLWKLKPNVAQVPKNTEVSLERENSTEGETGRDAECDITSHGSKSGKIAQLMGSSVQLMESASSSESRKEKKCTENIELVSPTRSRHSGKYGSSDQPSENETQIKKEIPKLLSVQEREEENLKGKQPGKTLKQRNQNYDSKTSSTSECENDHCRKMKHHQKVKPYVSRGRNLKPAPRKKSRNGSSKVNLVTLRASSQEEEEEEEDEPESEYEVESFLPEEVNKAPVFVPKGLRSPNPVPMHIEETMEELEIYENIADEPCISHDLNLSIQPVIQDDSKLYFSPVDITQEEQKKETGINDGSTEAAMTLLAMRDPVFQLRIDTQEKIQECLSKDELNLPASFLSQGNEVHTKAPSANELIPLNNTNNTTPEGNNNKPSDFKDCLEEKTVVLLPDSSKTALVSPHNTNETTTECHKFSDLEECSQEATRVCSTVSLCKRNKTPRPARYRLTKPKPNLNSGLVLPRNASQKSLDLSSDMEEYKEIQNVTDEKMSEKPTEEQKAELNLQMDEQLAKVSTAGKYDLHSESAGPAMQENNMESGNAVKKICEIASELTAPKRFQEAVACLSELPDNLSIKSNGSAEHQFSTAEVTQTEGNENASVSAMTEMSADAEEEPKFILTLVEISADSVECSSGPAALPHGSEELLPAPILFTSDNMDSLELTRDESVGSITASVEESAASVKDSTERGLQTASSEDLTDLDLTSWKNPKRSSITLEGSSVSEKIRPTAPIEEHLESSDKGTSDKLQHISRTAAELQAEEGEQPSLNSGAVFLDEAASEAGLMSGTLGAGQAETCKEQRLFVDSYSSVQSDQAGNGEVLSKTLLPRSYQRSLGFLPLICKINADEEVTAKENNKSLQKTCTLISENTAECPASTSKDNNREIQEYSSLPSTMLSPPKYESGSCSNVQVFPELSEEEGSAKEQEKEEPTRISEYFFSDIFMEVDDSE